MRTRFTSPGRRSAGYALLMVMTLAAVSIVIMAATLSRTMTESKLNDMNNQYVASLYAAEAGTEQVIARMRYDYMNSGIGAITNNLGLYQAIVPGTNISSYWANFLFSDGQGHANKMYVGYISNLAGALPSQYVGLNAYGPVYRVLSNVKQTNGRYNLTNSVQQDVVFTSIPVTQFAIFYNGLLEFTTCAPFTVNGRVHGNTNMYTGSGSQLTFNGQVTTVGTISQPSWNGQTAPYSQNGTFNPPYSTNTPNITLPIGTNSPHAIIDMPPPGESLTNPIAQQRLFNQAPIVLLVSNSTVTLIIQAGANGTLPAADLHPTVLTSSNTNAAVLSTNFPFLTLLWGTNGFYDQRQAATNITTQIDIGKYATWVSTNASVLGKYPAGSAPYPNILYVADNRTTTASQLPAVRLTNGVALPYNGGSGFSVATPDPLYVLGMYNCTNVAYQGTTNTTQSLPSALICDAITILSQSWKDSQSYYNGNMPSGTRAAANDTVNAAIITGNVPSTGPGGSQFSGGVHNLTRFLEDWSGKTLTLNTSIICLYGSTIATDQFRNPPNFSPAPINGYYYPPTRNYSYDLNYLNPAKEPPGTPCLPFFTRFGWAMPPPNNVTYNVSP